MPSPAEVLAARQKWLATPGGTDEEREAWEEFYELLFERPPGSRNATKEDLSPVILP